MSYKNHIIMGSSVLLLGAYVYYTSRQNKESESNLAKARMELAEARTAAARKHPGTTVLVHKIVEKKNDLSKNKDPESEKDSVEDRPPHDPEYENAKLQETISFLEELISSQKKNLAWSATAESELESMDKKFPDSQITAMDCRDGMCLINVEHKDSAAQQVWKNETPFSNTETMFDKRLTINVEDAGGKVVTKMFLVKQGVQFPQLVN